MKMLLDRWAVDNVGSFPNGQTRRSQRMRAKFITPIIFSLPCTEIKFWLSNWIKRNNQIVQLNSKKIHDPQSMYITDPTQHEQIKNMWSPGNDLFRALHAPNFLLRVASFLCFYFHLKCIDLMMVGFLCIINLNHQRSYSLLLFSNMKWIENRTVQWGNWCSAWIVSPVSFRSCLKCLSKKKKEKEWN
jgi:hypothetical protein